MNESSWIDLTRLLKLAWYICVEAEDINVYVYIHAHTFFFCHGKWNNKYTKREMYKKNQTWIYSSKAKPNQAKTSQAKPSQNRTQREISHTITWRECANFLNHEYTLIITIRSCVFLPSLSRCKREKERDREWICKSSASNYFRGILDVRIKSIPLENVNKSDILGW